MDSSPEHSGHHKRKQAPLHGSCFVRRAPRARDPGAYAPLPPSTRSPLRFRAGSGQMRPGATLFAGKPIAHGKQKRLLHLERAFVGRKLVRFEWRGRQEAARPMNSFYVGLPRNSARTWSAVIALPKYRFANAMINPTRCLHNSFLNSSSDTMRLVQVFCKFSVLHTRRKVNIAKTAM